MSELLFLGTGAADWILEERNGFFRRNSAALLDRKIMLDCGLHIFDFLEEYGNKELFENVTDILITHSHDDHYRKESVVKLAEKHKIRVACDIFTKNDIGNHENIEFVNLKPFKEFELDGYKIIPLLANHEMVCDEENLACHYIIETSDGKKLFYGLDGAWFLRPSWQEMKKHKFDVMVFDATCGDYHDWRIFEHNTIPMLREITEEIRVQKVISENGILVASHLARTLHLPHKETAEILEKFGVVCAYDGLTIEF